LIEVGGHNGPPIFISQKLKRMKIKNYKEWDYTLILVALMFLIAYLTSCSTQKVVYRVGDGWKQASQKSEVTGWARTIK
jgi:hypothetical protein